jgi:hypothetical protein
MTVNDRPLVSRGDLDYTYPATRSEEGMPVGNGRMGSLVWTTPTALHFQINRCDVFAENSYTVSFPQADSDYAAGCGLLDINLTSAGDDVFAGKNFRQHLSIDDALMTARGNGVTARVLAWPQRDARRCGAGARLTGAGFGCLLCYCPEAKQPQLRETLGLSEIQFSILW